MKFSAITAVLALGAASVNATPSRRAGSSKQVRGSMFQQFGFLILENTDYATAEADPTFQSIQNMKHNRLLSNYNGISHPSLPNYISTIAGSDLGVQDDGPPSKYNFPNPTILDLLDKKGISWKFYAENYPGNCFTGATDGKAHSYAAKHLPALYFNSIVSDNTRCANIVPATQFDQDVKAGTLPQWWYYVPTLNNDGHDTSTSYVANYLTQQWIPRFQDPTFTKDLAMVLTFDEAETYSGPNHVYAALIGDALKGVNGSHVDSTSYNHYSLMKIVEDNWGLGNIGTGDASATPLYTGPLVGGAPARYA
jgi:acid phosphatase